MNLMPNLFTMRLRKLTTWYCIQCRATLAELSTEIVSQKGPKPYVSRWIGTV